MATVVTDVTGSRPSVPVRAGKRLLHGFAEIGDQITFYAKAYAAVPYAIRRYRNEIYNLLAQVSLGSGALALIGGTVVVIGVLTAAGGIEVGLQGYTSLGNIGVGALAGFVSAYINPREIAPVLAGITLTATVGAGFTAQLGAMRVSEEIDALEVMAIRSVPYLVTTRIIAGFVAIIPLFAMGLIMSFAATKLVVIVFFRQAAGTYDHYFTTFLHPIDIVYSLAKAGAMAIAVISICCYYGFHAEGGPAGVGRAVGQAVRTSLIVVAVIDLLVGLGLYGSLDLHLAG
ncbi:MAG: transporter permease [Marmoricola sp.]|nr:transporter permease [Marmoricola sp.]